MARFGPGGTRSGSGGGSVMMFIVGFIILSGFLLFSYKLGSMGEGHHHSRQLELKENQRVLRKQIQDCHDNKARTEEHRRKSDSRSSEELRLLKEQNRKMEKQNDELSKSNDELERKNTECVEEAEAVREIWSEKDRVNAQSVKKLADHHTVLVKNSTRYTNTKGMGHILLDTSLRKLYREQQKLLQLLGKPNSTEDFETHLNNLLGKWEKAEEFDSHTNVGHAHDQSEFQQSHKKPKTNFTTYYDKTRESKSKIFFQAKDANGVYAKPTWNGRTGTNKLVSGVLDMDHIDPLPLAKVLRKLYDYALCAMGNADIFSYPTHFRYGTEKIESLVDVLETPLLNFCKDCKPQETTGVFRLACQGFSTQEQYGSIFFWRMRSRIRFSSSVMAAADEFISGNGLEMAMAVRLKRNGFDKECETQWKTGVPQLAFTRLLEGTAQIFSSDFEKQCYPSEAHVIQTLNAHVADNKNIEKIYFSTDASEEEWSSLSQQITVPIVRLPQMDTAHGQAVDMAISSKCKSVLINRFDVTSSQIVELTLLEKKLSHRGVMVW